MRFLKWLYPGMQVKRWVVLAVAGILFFGMGAALLTVEGNIVQRGVALILVLLGLSGLGIGVILTLRSLLDVVSTSDQDLVERVFQRRHLEKGPKIVAIGGGTGLSTLLSGLKQYTSNITAIVTVADDGGSSGRLREEFAVLPPGDIRNCLVALAEAEPLVQQLFQYRFGGESALQGHSFGNLFITALTKVTGDFEQAVQAASQVLAIRGKVIPSTNADVRLVAEHEDGSLTLGESKIPYAQSAIRRIYLEPKDCQAIPEALQAIRDAQAIVFGPGSLFTSIIPNLLVGKMAETIVQSKATKIYICNVMTQHRETRGFKASDHVKAIVSHTNPGIIQVCVVNNQLIPQDLIERYRKEDAVPVEGDADHIRQMGYQVLEEDLVSLDNHVRHDPDKVAKILIQLVIGGRGRLLAATRNPDLARGLRTA